MRPITTEAQAEQHILPLLGLTPEQLRQVGDEEFKAAWFGIAFLYGGLHPDDVPNSGAQMHVMNDHENWSSVPNLDPRLVNPYDKISGWPLILIPIGLEAYRRNRMLRMTEEEYYPRAANHDGQVFRRN